MSERLKSEPIPRRDFLGLAGLWAASIAIFGSLLGMVKLLKPSVTPETSGRFPIGYPADFSEGTVISMPENRVRIHSTEKGIMALSMVCTHLGCIVHESGDGFICPCHGSKFDHDGNVLTGPAPRGLRWHEVSQAANGKLMVNIKREVPVGTYYLA